MYVYHTLFILKAGILL